VVKGLMEWGGPTADRDLLIWTSLVVQLLCCSSSETSPRPPPRAVQPERRRLTRRYNVREEDLAFRARVRAQLAPSTPGSRWLLQHPTTAREPRKLERPWRHPP